MLVPSILELTAAPNKDNKESQINVRWQDHMKEAESNALSNYYTVNQMSELTSVFSLGFFEGKVPFTLSFALS